MRDFGVDGPPLGRLGDLLVGKKMRRERLTASVRAKVIAIAATAGVIAAVAATSTPTGHPQIDAIERGVVAAIIAVAGSRARRWSLVTAALAVGVTTSGWWIVSGIVAMGLAGLLIVPNRRGRVIGAAAGGSIAVASFHLGVTWFPHASLVVGAGASLLVAGSAWNHLDDELRHRWKVAAITAVSLIVAMIGLSGLSVLAVRDDLTRAAASTGAGVSSLRGGNASEAAASFGRASDDFEVARLALTGAWLWPARLVPVLSQNLRAVRDVTVVGVDLTGAAATSASSVDYDQVRRADGGIDLAVVRSFRKPIGDAAATLVSSRRTLTESDSPLLLPPLASRFDEFRRNVERLTDEAEVAAEAVARGPALLGEGTPRRYLVLLGNPAESRDLGGEIGNWAELLVTDGKIELVQVGAPLDLIPPGVSTPFDPDTYPPSVNEMRPALFPQNWGSSPDLPTVTRLSASLFERVTGRAIDGVLYADPFAFAAFVGIVGPTDVPQLPGVKVSSDNAAQFVMADQYSAFPDDGAANDALEEVIRSVFDRLTRVQLPGPRSLATTFAPLARQGRFQMSTMHDGDAPLLDMLHLSGAIPVAEGVDLLGVVARNANPSKIDLFMHRTTHSVVRWNPETGEVGATVTVSLRNDAPSTGLSPTVIGNAAGLPSGTNLTDIALLTPFQLLRTNVDGDREAARPTWDGQYWRHQIRLVIPAGEEVVVRFELEGLVRAGPTYRMNLVGQPVAGTATMSVQVVPTSGSVTRNRGDGGVVTVDGTEDRELVFRWAES